MKDEIKEILRDLEFCSDIFDYTITPDRCTFLKNYIINLQEENERLNKEISRIMEIIDLNAYNYGYQIEEEITGGDSNE